MAGALDFGESNPGFANDLEGYSSSLEILLFDEYGLVKINIKQPAYCVNRADLFRNISA